MMVSHFNHNRSLRPQDGICKLKFKDGEEVIAEVRRYDSYAMNTSTALGCTRLSRDVKLE